MPPVVTLTLSLLQSSYGRHLQRQRLAGGELQPREGGRLKCGLLAILVTLMYLVRATGRQCRRHISELDIIRELTVRSGEGSGGSIRHTRKFPA